MDTTTTAMWQDFVTYGNDQPNPQTMIENERVRIIIAGLRPGQRIPIHPEAAAVYHFLEGKGTMTVNDEQFPVQPGTVIVMDEGAQRGLLAETQLVFMAVRLA
jgi:mannose-6-phosphate isomerase-like protein (cupin superfamily)